MKYFFLIILLISIVSFSLIPNHYNDDGAFLDEYDTIKQNEYYITDTIGIRYISNRGAANYYFEANDGGGGLGILDVYPGNSILGFRAYNERNEIQSTGTGINLLSLYNDSLHLGTSLFVGQFDAKFYDFRPLKRGIEYNESGYVKQPHSLTDKEYVDKHQLSSKVKTALPSPSPAGQIIYVNNAFGGGVPAYSDGISWRRVSDQTIIN